MPTFIRCLLSLIVALSAGCASLVDGPDRPPTAAELVGVYDYGHTGFAETLELRSDQSYERTLHGHLGQDSATFHGSWRIAGKNIAFAAAADEPARSAPDPAEAFFYRRRPAFAPQRLIDSGKVPDWFVYLRRVSK